MSTHPLLSFADSKDAPQAGAVLNYARGLAQLAFGSLSHVTEFTQTRHLALLPPESLELDLSDPAQRQFGDYELLELLGEGGMGVVYRARQISLDREVAVKLLAAGPWASKDFIARFEREAQNAARMQHPNIVTVYEVGSFEGLQFFSMRLVRGSSLSSKLKHGERLAPKTAAALMRTIAEAVGYAHSLGVLHLDLKPANVLLDEAGTPYVADFGLARRLENALAVENTEISGTPAYMAPEQAQVRAYKLTAATDIWGLGAILYELLTGQPPFRADTAQDTVKLVQEGQVRAPRRLRPELPLDLEAIVLRCLTRDPRERYPSARALADDLARYVEGRPVQARPLNAIQRMGRWARREPELATTVACAVAALLAGLIATTYQWRRADSSAAAARDSLWATRAQTAQQALSAGDGFRGLRPLIANLAEMEAAGLAARAKIERERIGTILANAPQLVDLLSLPLGETASSLAISPDGRRFAVATIDGDNVRRVRQYELATLRETWAVSTEDHTFLAGGGDFGAPRGNLHYSADGRFLLLSTMEQPVVPTPRTSDMLAMDARDGRILEPDKLPERQADIVYDDALKHALVRYRSDQGLRWPDAAQFYEVDGWRPVGPRHTVATTLAADFWLPMPDGSAWLGSRDGADLALYQVPDLVPRWRLQLPQTSLVRAWNFSRDGRWLALGSIDGTVRLVSVVDGRAADLSSGPGERVVRVQFSDDGRTLAALDENGDLWSWDLATRSPRAAPMRLAPGDGVTAMLHFAGDTVFGGGNSFGSESEIAYAMLAPRALFNNQTVPGAVRVHAMTQFGAAFDVSVSAHRLLTAAGGGTVQVWRLPPSPLLPARAAPLPPLAQTFDGTHLVAVDGDSVRIIDAATGEPRSPPLRHPEPVRFAEFGPGGRSLVTIAGRTVRVIDPSNWQLRGAPILLPETPERVALAQDAPVLVAITAEYRSGERRNVIHRIDLARGAEIGEPKNIVALQEFEIDAQGRYALVATFGRTRPTAIMRIDLTGAAAPCPVKIRGVWSDALAADGLTAWFATPTPNSQLTLRHWDLAACRELPVAETPRLPADAVLMPLGDGLLVHRGGDAALIRIGADGRRIAAIGGAVPNAMYEFALSADGERAAIATRNAVHLLDAHGGLRLSAPLAAPIAGDDAIAKLAFSPDGARLIARTINHRWLFWNLPRAAASAADLGRLARALDPRPGEPFLSDTEVRALRALLHAGAPAPPSSSTAANVPVVFAPANGAGIDPRFVPLDLASAINVPMIGKTWAEPLAGGDLPTLTSGLQRFLGVDYRVEGGVQLSGGGSSLALAPQLRRSNVVAVPDVTARRVHVLAFMHIPMNGGQPPRAFAWVVLIGADGRETRLEIRTVRDVLTHGINPKRISPSARIAWIDVESETVRTGGDPSQPWSATYAVSLDVPPGIGPIRGLRFDVADGPMEAPLLYAATLERADADEAGKTGLHRAAISAVAKP